MRRPFEICGIIFHRRSDAEMFFRRMLNVGKPGTVILGSNEFLAALVAALPEKVAEIAGRNVVRYSRGIRQGRQRTRCFYAELQDGKRISFGFDEAIRNIISEQHPPPGSVAPETSQAGKSIPTRQWTSGELENEIGRVLAEHATLTIDGFENPVSVDDPKFVARREELRHDPGLIAAVHDWINQFAKIQAMNRSRTSYGLKHAAEQALSRYVAPGQLIAAALLAGFQFEHVGPNVWLNISKRVPDADSDAERHPMYDRRRHPWPG